MTYLHSHDSSTAKLNFIFVTLQVEMQFTAAFVLSLIFPVHVLAPLRAERDRNDGTLTHWFGFQAVYHISDFLIHTITVVSLSSAAFGELPLLVLRLGILPSHVFLRVVIKCTSWKELRLYKRGIRRYILNHTNKIADNKLATLLYVVFRNEMVPVSSKKSAIE